eukprot:Rhum_TRINITY_DN14409_c21_g1::Rhum_TRINITY_DN14409_c21_g1_i1::g.88461::m.88461
MPFLSNAQSVLSSPRALVGFMAALAAQPTDDPVDALRKTLMLGSALLLVTCSVVILIFGSLYYRYYFFEYPSSIGWYPFPPLAIASVLCISYILRTKSCPQWLIYSCVCTFVVSILVLDFEAVATWRFGREWTWVMLAVDTLLTMRMPRSAANCVVGGTAAYFVLVELSKVVDVPPSDLPLEALTLYRNDLCNCEKPPCTRPTDGAHTTLWHLVIFLLDYYFIRNFADDAEGEREKLQASIGASYSVAQHLGSFNLDAASELLFPDEDPLLASDTKLPADMHKSLVTLLNNLRMYRPFLPDSLFTETDPEASAEPDFGPRLAPTTPNAALVYVDLVGGAELWEALPNMRAVTTTYKSVVAHVAEKLGGYEVKAVGDAVLVAFERVDDGARFALGLQERLLEAPWPNELLSIGASSVSPDERGLWRGAIVNIGLHYGNVSTDLDPVTGRTDYHGPTVDAALKLQDAAFSGSVMVSAKVLSHVDGVALDFASFPVGISELGDEPMDIVAVYPTKLAGRRKKPGWKPICSGLPAAPAGQAASPSRPRLDTVMSVIPMEKKRRGKVVNVSGAVTGSLRKHGRRQATVACTELIGGEEQTEAQNAWKSPRSSMQEIDGWCDTVNHVLSSIDRCQGKVTAVAGSSVSVSWNTVQACPGHLENGLRFVRLLGIVKRQGLSTQPSYAIGMSNGHVLYGTLGNSHQRFMNVMGECVVLCKRLSDAALAWKDLCLFSSLLANSHHTRVEGFTFQNQNEKWQGFEQSKYRTCDVLSVAPVIDPTNPIVAAVAEYGWAPAALEQSEYGGSSSCATPPASFIQSGKSSGLASSRSTRSGRSSTRSATSSRPVGGGSVNSRSQRSGRRQQAAEGGGGGGGG